MALKKCRLWMGLAVDVAAPAYMLQSLRSEFETPWSPSSFRHAQTLCPSILNKTKTYALPEKDSYSHITSCIDFLLNAGNSDAFAVTRLLSLDARYWLLIASLSIILSNLKRYHALPLYDLPPNPSSSRCGCAAHRTPPLSAHRSTGDRAPSNSWKK